MLETEYSFKLCIYFLLSQKNTGKTWKRRNEDRGENGHQKRRNRKMLLRKTATSASERNRRNIQTKTEKIKNEAQIKRNLKGREYRKTRRLPTQQKQKQIRQRQWKKWAMLLRKKPKRHNTGHRMRMMVQGTKHTCALFVTVSSLAMIQDVISAGMI